MRVVLLDARKPLRSRSRSRRSGSPCRRPSSGTTTGSSTRPARPTCPPSEKGIRLAQKIEVGPCFPVGKQLERATVGPLSVFLSPVTGYSPAGLVALDFIRCARIARGSIWEREARRTWLFYARRRHVTRQYVSHNALFGMLVTHCRVTLRDGMHALTV